MHLPLNALWWIKRLQAYKVLVQVMTNWFYAPFDGELVSLDLQVGAPINPGNPVGYFFNKSQVEIVTFLVRKLTAWKGAVKYL